MDPDPVNLSPDPLSWAANLILIIGADALVTKLEKLVCFASAWIRCGSVITESFILILNPDLGSEKYGYLRTGFWILDTECF